MKPSLAARVSMRRIPQSMWSAVRTLSVRVWLPIGIILVVGLVAFGAFSSDLSTIDAIANVLMFMTLAQAWNVLGGYGGYMNFGMAAFFGIGAYTTAVIAQYTEISPILAVPVAGAVGVLFGVVVGVPTLRLRGAYFAIATLIVTFAVQLLVQNNQFTQGSLGIYLKMLPFEPQTTEQIFYFTFLVLAAAATAAVYMIEHSNFGWAMVAIREDEDAAEVLGVRTTRVKIAGLLAGALMAGVVGGIYSYRVLYIEPSGTFAFDTSLNVVLMTVLGGAGFWQGPVIGTPVIMIVADVLRVSVASELNRVIFGTLLILVAIFVPNGVMGLVRGVRGSRLTV